MNGNKAKLSKSILEMKFMKRTKEKVENEQFQEEGQEYFGNQLTIQMKKESERFITQPSYIFCEDLIDGRVSYQGMNPEIEKLMEIEENNKRAKLEVKQETDISDEQMANHWISMRKRVKNEYKYTKTENIKDVDEPVKKRSKFLKPSD